MWFHEFFVATVRFSGSGIWMCFRFRICQIVPGISIISQLHEFLNQIFDGFLSSNNVIIILFVLLTVIKHYSYILLKPRK